MTFIVYLGLATPKPCATAKKQPALAFPDRLTGPMQFSLKLSSAAFALSATDSTRIERLFEKHVEGMTFWKLNGPTMDEGAIVAKTLSCD